MRTRLLLPLLLLFGSMAWGQAVRPSTRNHFFAVNPLGNFGVGYLHKQQISDELWWRAGVSHLLLRAQDAQIQNTHKQLFLAECATEAGLEWRHSFGRVFTLYHGPFVGLEGAFTRSRQHDLDAIRLDSDTRYLGVSMGYTVGAMIRASDHFSFALQANPAVTGMQIKARGLMSPPQTSRGIGFGTLAGYGSIGLVFVP